MQFCYPLRQNKGLNKKKWNAMCAYREKVVTLQPILKGRKKVWT